MSSQTMKALRRTTAQRKTAVFGAGVAAGLACLVGVAFACTPIAGRMEVQAIDDSGEPVGNKSVTIGSRGLSMEFCYDPGSIQGGASAHDDDDTFEPDRIRIVVAPAVCVNGGGLLDTVLNHLPNDQEADINFHQSVFEISGGSYTYTNNVTNDCMTDPDNAGVITVGTMRVAEGFGTADVTVPAALVNNKPEGPTSLGDAAGVCVDAFFEAPNLPTRRAIAMAPLFVI